VTVGNCKGLLAVDDHRGFARMACIALRDAGDDPASSALSDAEGGQLFWWVVLVDDLTSRGGKEQSTVHGSLFDAPGPLGGVAMLECGALKGAAVGQLHWQDTLLDDQGASFMDEGMACSCALKNAADGQ
jgi:hypothetical protein